MENTDDELRSAALQNAQSMLQARHRVEQDLLRAKEDIERKTEQLHLQTEWLRVTLESIGDAVIAVDIQPRVSFLNAAAEALTGWSTLDAMGLKVTELMTLIHEITRGQVPNPIERVFTEGRRVAIMGPCMLVRRDGTEVAVEASASPLLNAAGDLLGVVMICRDVSEDRKRELALAQSEERYRLLSTIAPHLLWTTDPQGRVEYFNERWYEYTGQTPSDALADGWNHALHPDDVEPTLVAWHHAIATGDEYEVEYRLRRHDGIYRWFVAQGVPLRNDDGVITRWYGSCTDIHQRRFTAEALREESKITEQLFAVAKALSTELDMAKVVQIITDAGTVVTGAQFGAFFYNVVGSSGDSYMLYTLSGAPREAFEKFPMPRATDLFGPTFRGEGAIRLGDVRTDPRFGHNAPYHGMPAGHLPVVSYLAVPVVSRSGKVIGGLFFGHPDPDVFTDRDERIIVGIAAQAASAMDTSQLYQAEQQARSLAEAASHAKDRFLAVLSHELRTPLTPVLLTAGTLESSTELSAEVRSDMAMIRRNVELEARLIDDLLDLSRIVSGKLALNEEPVNVNETVRHVFTICGARASEKGVALVTTLDPGVGWISADPARLQQVLWNLVNNAVKFTPEGGQVEIVTRHRQDDCVELQVRDTGMGIEPDVLPQIFDAFEQGPAGMTRQYGGLGLGLAITKALVELHKGTLSASSPGKGGGSVFTVTIPVGSPTYLPKSKTTGTLTSPVPLREIRLLVVEDHADTARILASLLRRAGFTVVMADCVASASKCIEQQRFDILVSDLGLPDGSGYDVMRLVRDKLAVPGIAMSGYGREEDLQRSHEAGFAEHLVKPIVITQLVEAVRRLVSRK